MRMRGLTIASEPTGMPTGFRSDVVATAKRALKCGKVLDGEGGYCVWGKQVPGFAHGVPLKRDVAEGECLKWSDVICDETDIAVKTRWEMEAAFRPASSS